MESINIDLYKVASFEITHYPLLKKIALTRKPVILSTGMASIKEINLALKTLKSNGCKNIIILKCTSSYPADLNDSNLKTIKDMMKKFNLNIGLSDHSIGFANSILAILLGACVIEKHVTIDKNDGGLDSKFSLEAKDFKKFVYECKNVKKALGKIYYGPTKNELSSLKYRRSIYVSKDIKKGEIITKKNIKIVRPSLSLNPIYYEKIMGRKVQNSLKYGDKISLKDLKK